MDVSIWKLGNPLLAVSPWSQNTGFLALAPAAHGAQVLAMIGLLIAATQVTSTIDDLKQIDGAPSWLRWAACQVARLGLHVVCETWLVYRHSRRFRPQPWLLADIEANAAAPMAEGRRNGGEEPREEEDAGGIPLTPLRPDERRPDTPIPAGPQPRPAAPRASASQAPSASNSTDNIAEAEESQAGSTRAQPATSPRGASSSAGSASPARDGSVKDAAPDPAGALAILDTPPAQIAAFVPSSAAEAAKRRAARLARLDAWAALADLWLCAAGFLMWVVALVITIPVEPVRSWHPLIFACVQVGLVSAWFTAFGFAACLALWLAGYALILGAWVLWRLGILRGPAPQMFRAVAGKKLPKEALQRCPLVLYAPDPSEPRPEYDMDEIEGTPLDLADIDRAKLQHPLRVLEASRATCGICHAEFVPPCTIAGQAEYRVEVLRELPCRHVFHRECVDEWLLRHAETCPYCTQSVSALLRAPPRLDDASVRAQAGSAASESAAELAALRRTLSRRSTRRSTRSVRSARSAPSEMGVPEAPEGEKGKGTEEDGASRASTPAEFHEAHSQPSAGPSRVPSSSAVGYETAPSSLSPTPRSSLPPPPKAGEGEEAQKEGVI